MTIPHSMMHLLQLLVSAAALAAIAPFYLRISSINQFFFFGRNLPASFTGSDAARQISEKFSQEMKKGLLLAFCLLATFGSGVLHITPYSALAIALLYLCVFFHVRFAQGHRKAGEAFARSGIEKSAADDDAGVVSVALSPEDREFRMGVPQMVFPAIVTLLVWLATVFLGHTGFAGFMDTVGAIGGAALFGLCMGMLCASTALLLLMRFSARYHTPMAQRSMWLSLLLGWASAVLFAGICGAVATHSRLTPTLGRVIMIALLTLVFLNLVYVYRRRNRYVPPAVERTGGDEYWKWGLYYHNANDPALFVQNRGLPGFTLNFANIFSWPIALFVLADFGFLFFLSLHR